MGSKDIVITYSKGIAIILMVLGHAGTSGYLHDLIYMFHMPLFFFFSGYCFKEKYIKIGFYFVKRRIMSLYVPYVKWSVLFILIHFLLMQVYWYRNLFSVEYQYGLKDFVVQSIYIICTMSKCPTILGGLWFLKSLLIASTLSLFLMKTLRNKGAILFLIIILLLSSKYLLAPNSVTDILNLGLLASVFFMCGVVMRKRNKGLLFNRELIALLTLIVLILAYFTPAEMGTVKSYNIIPYIIAGLSGTIVLYKICLQLDSSGLILLKRILVILGDNSLDVLIWHMLSFKVVSAFIILIYGLEYKRIVDTPVIGDYAVKGWWIGYSVVSLIILVIYITKLKKYNRC